MRHRSKELTRIMDKVAKLVMETRRRSGRMYIFLVLIGHKYVLVLVGIRIRLV